MPWIPDLKREEENNMIEKQKLGLITDKELK
jgi:hypothetical protein